MWLDKIVSEEPNWSSFYLGVYCLFIPTTSLMDAIGDNSKKHDHHHHHRSLDLRANLYVSRRSDRIVHGINDRCFYTERQYQFGLSYSYLFHGQAANTLGRNLLVHRDMSPSLRQLIPMRLLNKRNSVSVLWQYPQK